MSRRTRFAILALGILTMGLARANAQEPAPVVRDVTQRSGLITRHIPITPNLPPDADRDRWYVTRWGDDNESHDGVNSFKNGGLYGRQWKNGCTACYSPYFAGSPGQNTMTHTCKVNNRLLTNFVHPFRPVCSYYAGGCYVPVYDLDPAVPGPGPFPFKYFFKRPTGG